MLDVFVPYAEIGGRLESPYYDYPEFRADLASWIDPYPWRWTPVTTASLATAVANAEGATVLNLCDGDDLNLYPGLSVINALEEAGIEFTGADSRFYALSTSKTAMKRRFIASGVPTSPWMTIRDVEADIDAAVRDIGFPLFIKPDVSFAAAGISNASVVDTAADGVLRVKRLLHGMHGCLFTEGGIFAERFLPGREFTVLVVSGGPSFSGERLFHPALPPRQRFLTFERQSGEYIDDAPLPDRAESYRYGPVNGALATSLGILASNAFNALDGCGYARVDCRENADGALMVMEVNANCALGSDDYCSVGELLKLAGKDMRYLLPLLLRDAHRRRNGTQS